MLVVELADPRADGPRQLLEASHALMQASFPPEENYFLDIEALCADNIRFFAAREGKTTLGTGALALMGAYGEVKSMFTDPKARGKGVAAALLRQIEDQARELGLSHLRLETGDPLEAAVRLYERNGFVRCGIFGDYEPNKTSVYMEKPLS
ncbi:GNAT family N-acetyltransferase [Roseovarius phycicola]|uniref:GNAT family N-acetyltransferase n=1 Tax=Roseovarius phycicola TaxID=3080976 RepID=A0ABZ2HHM7_9RHOB